MHDAITINGLDAVPTQFITISDLEVHGRINIEWATGRPGANGQNGCDGIIIERVKFICPSALGTFNDANLITQWSVGEGYVDGLVIRENMFVVDNTCQNGGPYNYAGFGEYPNSYFYNGRHEHPDGIHLYSTRGALIERNDFIWSNSFLPSSEQSTYTFYFKGPNREGVFRYNLARGGEGKFGHNKSEGTGNEIHHNIVDDAGGILHGDVGPLANDKVYNNTIYSPNTSSWDYRQDSPAGSGNELFNNLFLGDPPVGWNYIDNNWGNDDWCARFVVFDYNLYWPAADTAVRWQNGPNDFSTWASWQNHMLSHCGAGLKDESNSRRVDPQLEDPANHRFKPRAGSPAMSGGRGGGYPSYVGAYSGPSDSTQIGCGFNAQCSAFGSGGGAGDPPADVHGTERTDVKP